MTQLARRLTLVDAVVIGLGSMIGAGVFAVCLVSYELTVRHSFMGRWLNGRRVPWRRRPAEPLTETVARILSRRNIRLEENLDDLMTAWPELAGPDLEGRVRPGKCEQHILYLYAATSADIFELRRFKLRALEARIKQHPAGKTIRQVRIQLDPG